jgi:Ca-activated chloride channel family protein
MKNQSHAGRVLVLAAAISIAAAGCSNTSGDESFIRDSSTYDAVFGDSIPTQDSYPYDSISPDMTADAAYDSVVPDVPPDPAADTEEEADVEEDEVEPNVCDLPVEEPQIFYLSADDSNSQASPVVVRWMIQSGQNVPWYAVRTYEFLNYYTLAYEPPARGRVSVTAQMAPDPDDEALYDLQIGVQGHLLDQAGRRPLNITFSLDTSGSMSGGPIERLKAVCRAIAGRLKAGDVVSMVKWSTTQAVLLDSHAVSGPDDSTLMSVISGLSSDGGTDLHAGLAAAYELADENYSTERLNRVVLVSDGQANVGITDEDLIAAYADDEEREGIYLVGVGTGDGYNDTLMDAVTDAGKGAYVFIDTVVEAEKMFGERFLANLEIAVMDVQVQLTLPSILRMEIFYGEEISTSPKEVEPQHLAPNDAMIFQQKIRSCGDLIETDVIRAVATYKDPVTRESRSDSFEAPASTILENAGSQLIKGRAIVEYAEGLKEIDQATDWEEKGEICTQALARVQAAADELDDPELRDIASLLGTYCVRF